MAIPCIHQKKSCLSEAVVYWGLLCKRGLYLYSEKDAAEDLKLRMNSGSTYEGNVEPRDDIYVTKHGLKIHADVDNYSAFVSRMQASESEFRQMLVK